MEHLESLHLNLRGTQLQVALQRSHTDRRTDPASDLAACMTLQPDTLVALSYPAETVRFTEQARRVGFNPRFFYAAVGTAYPSFAQHFGAAAHGTLGMASWNRKSGAGAQAYFDAHVRRFGREPDRWASGHTYAALQVLQAAVQQAGLDRKDIRAFIANRGADTILGPMHFRRGELASIPGMVGQWQNGEFEVVWPPERATAPLLAPKPRWPAA
jgi:branched-chain amino acid transport system substrate-binding protein